MPNCLAIIAFTPWQRNLVIYCCFRMHLTCSLTRICLCLHGKKTLLLHKTLWRFFIFKFSTVFPWTSFPESAFVSEAWNIKTATKNCCTHKNVKTFSARVLLSLVAKVKKKKNHFSARKNNEQEIKSNKDTFLLHFVVQKVFSETFSWTQVLNDACLQRFESECKIIEIEGENLSWKCI